MVREVSSKLGAIDEGVVAKTDDDGCVNMCEMDCISADAEDGEYKNEQKDFVDPDVDMVLEEGFHSVSES